MTIEVRTSAYLFFCQIVTSIVFEEWTANMSKFTAAARTIELGRVLKFVPKTVWNIAILINFQSTLKGTLSS